MEQKDLQVGSVGSVVVIDAHIVRELSVTGLRGARGDAAPSHLSAASGLARVGQHLYVVADDELALGVFDLADEGPGTLFALFDGELPALHTARKKAKPDLEALTVLPAVAGQPGGALLALGSGSRPNRQRAVRVDLDAHGAVAGAPRRFDFAPLFAALREHIAELNIEGAFIDGDDFCLLQRGHARVPLNACARFAWHEVEAWLRAAGPVPAVASIHRYELGALGGVPLGFTDGAALPGGGWVFCAAAEDTDDAYADGRCEGSALGWVDTAGALRRLQPLALRCKCEGIAATVDGDSAQLWLVTDADDRGKPAWLLGASLALA